MRVNEVHVAYQEGMRFNLYTLADTHVGNSNAQLKQVEALVAECANDPVGLITIIGDMGDYITYTDKRFDPTTLDTNVIRSVADLQNLPAIYAHYLTNLLEPVRDKIICMTTGTHERSIAKMFQDDPLWTVCKNLGLEDRWGGWACMTKLTFRDEHKHHDSFRIFQSHGWQSGRKSGAISNNLDDMMGWIQCDLLLQAHSHQYIVKHKVILLEVDGELTQQVCIGAHTGGWLLTYKQQKGSPKVNAAGGLIEGPSYAEQFGFPPTVIGSPRFQFTPTRYGHGTVSA